MDEIVSVIPGAQFHRRKVYDVQEVVQFAKTEEYTDIVMVNEDRKKPRA